MLSRRTFVAASLAFAASPALAQKEDIYSETMIWRDPAIPPAGKADGDLTVVEYSDYNCPYCRKAYPVIRKVVLEDGNIRLVHKLWPVFGPASIASAKLTLATRGQGKYIEAYDALMSSTSRVTEGSAEKTLASAGIDVTRAKQELQKNSAEIDRILKRNNDQAEGFSFRGTPSFIIGKFRLFGSHDEEVYKQAIADARKMLKGG